MRHTCETDEVRSHDPPPTLTVEDEVRTPTTIDDFPYASRRGEYGSKGPVFGSPRLSLADSYPASVFSSSSGATPFAPYLTVTPADHQNSQQAPSRVDWMDEKVDNVVGKKAVEAEETLEEKLAGSAVTALVHKPHSDLAMRISTITNASRSGLDMAAMISKFALETAKLSTKTGLNIAKAVTGVMSGAVVQALTNDRERNFLPSLIDASTGLLHSTLYLTEQIALTGLELTSETVQYAISTASESIGVVDTLFGTTDTAKALAEFVQLVKREWNNRDDFFDDMDIGSFGAFRAVKALTAWACLQYVTSTRWESEMTGWRRVRLVAARELLDEWQEISLDDVTHEEVDCLEDEDDDEMVMVTSSKDNLVVGELTPRQELQGFCWQQDPPRKYRNRVASAPSAFDAHGNKRLGAAFSESAKRFSNPYLDEYVDQTEEEKLCNVIHNLKRYSKFSSSAYDFSTLMVRLPFVTSGWHDTGRLHRFKFARQAELPLDSIVHSSHQSAPKCSHYSPTHYLIRDRSTKSIILALRGTLSLHDLLVDLTCEYVDFQLPEDIQRGDLRKHKVHKGMYEAAKALVTSSEPDGVFAALKRELEENEDYGLVLIGHSLGAGIASLLALLLASPTTRMTSRWSKLPLGRRVHAYAFATPCCMSAELSKRSKTLVTSVAYGNDVIPRLSIGHVRDLRNMVWFLGARTDPDSDRDLASTIISRVLEYRSRMFTNDESARQAKKEFEDYFWQTRQVIHTRMQSNKLYPAGRLYWIVGKDRLPYALAKDDLERRESCESKYNMIEVEDVEKMFEEIWFSPHMITDHFPQVYECVLKNL